MSIETGLSIRVGPLLTAGDGVSTLIEVASAGATDVMIAIALDMSDSSRGLAGLIERLPRLLNTVPRTIPLVPFRLSDPQPLTLLEPRRRGPTQDGGTMSVGDLVDGAADLCGVLQDRAMATESLGRGSFLAPVMSRIEQFKAERGVEDVWLLVLTDGELTDFTPVRVPSGVRVAGLCATLDPLGAASWRRVLPCSPLFSLSDARLDEWLTGKQLPIAGRCTVKLDADRGVPARFVDHRHQLKPMADSGVEWDFDSGPLLLLTGCANAAWKMTVRSIATNRAVTLAPSDAVGAPSEPAQSAASMAMAPSQGVHADVLIDVCAGSADFPALWKDAAEAASRATAHQQWAGPAGNLSVFASISVRAKDAGADALLCLCNGDPRGDASSESRMLLLALRRDPRPALRWVKGEPLPIGVPEAGLQLDYDPMESRWLAIAGDGVVTELDPRGADELVLPAIRGSEYSAWKAFFSGDVKR